MASSSFGQWLKQRRRAFDLTQEELARRVGCAVVTIFKIEAGERRPSKQIAALLAQQLAIPAADVASFVEFARTGSAARGASPWGTAFHPPTNLPTPPTPLIGRTEDIALVRKRLLRQDTRVLTLLGPPGIGKTRLSLAVANDMLDEFPDGVFLILLAPISEPDLVLRAIIQTFDLPDVARQLPLERLKQHLRDKHMLLVLDNFEQVLAAAPDVAALLTACPFLKILVTSRAPLRIRSERQFPVPALALPDLNHITHVDLLSDYPAVELFVERAQAVRPDFSLTADNAQAVTSICTRLDGLPLAIELISARTKLLPPVTLLQQLHGRLMLQSDGLRDLEPRHRTLNAAIGWSYALLNEREQTLFMRLGVFVGGWTLDAVEAVCQPETSALDSMASLVDKSLVQTRPGVRGETRFMMLETIREFALTVLTENETLDDVRQRHAAFFLTLAVTPDVFWLDRIDLDYDNLRAALAWYLDHDLATGIRLASAAVAYWIQRGRLLDGRYWLENLVAASQQEQTLSLESRRELLRWAAALAYFEEDLGVMRMHSAVLEALGQQECDDASLAYAYFFLGQVALVERDLARARILFEDALILSRASGAIGHAASTLMMLGLTAGEQGDLEQAWAYNADSLALNHQLGNQWSVALLLTNNGLIKEKQGQYQEALALCRQSVQLSRPLNDKRTLSVILGRIGGLLGLEGEHVRAARLMGAAEALRESVFLPIEPSNRVHYDRWEAQIRAHLDETTFKASWAEGRLMTLDQAVEYALSDE